MPDYSQGKVYRIVCRKSNLQYIGSTTQPVSKRVSWHKNNYRYNKTNCTSYQVMQGDDYFVEILEVCPCETKNELLARERHWIEKEACVNKCIPNRSHAESMRAWQKNNREKWNAYMREYIRKKREAQATLATK